MYTDNNPFRHLTSAKLGATEQRRAAELSSFDFELKYRSGKSNQNADALSRQNPADSGKFDFGYYYSSLPYAGDGAAFTSAGDSGS